VHADARERTVGVKITTAPWQGRFWNYALRAGMRVPLAGKVQWMLPDGPLPCFRATATDIAYTFAPCAGTHRAGRAGAATAPRKAARAARVRAKPSMGPCGLGAFPRPRSNGLAGADTATVPP
jgi:hypothetical protein